MNRDIKIKILSIAMRYIEDYNNGETSPLMNEVITLPSRVAIRLDKFDDPTTQQIYDIMFRRMETLTTKYEGERTIPNMNFNFGDDS
jgi:hypothetical protein